MPTPSEIIDALRAKATAKPTERNVPLGYLADALRNAHDFARAPFGYENPPGEFVSDALGIPAVAGTLDKMSRGQSVTHKDYGVPLPTWEATQAGLATLPMVGPAIRGGKALGKMLPKDIPVGLSIKDVGEYGMSHRPMTVAQGAAPLHDLSAAFDETIYSHAGLQNYGTGNSLMDKQALNAFKSVRGNPKAEITAYRAVPLDASQSALNSGDWVTVSKDYAKSHGESALGGKYKIIEQKVPASFLTTNADSILEQGYYPTGK
jgi:hypothetical protein